LIILYIYIFATISNIIYEDCLIVL